MIQTRSSICGIFYRPGILKNKRAETEIIRYEMWPRRFKVLGVINVSSKTKV